MVDELPAAEVARLRSAPLTYDEVGATLAGDPPAGYGHLSRSRDLPSEAFDSAAERLMSWRVPERAGLRVAASSPRVAEGEVVLMRLGVGPLALPIPCRVVLAVDEPDRVGFAYGTLPGHPERGEELFLLERIHGGARFVITAFSRPATLPARLAGPVGRAFQGVMTGRYLRAIHPG